MSLEILQPYKVSMVYNDLNQNEIYNDISYTLETLTIIMNDVFNKINYRISNEKNKLDTIKLRINKCKLKVDEIRGSQNATTIFSTAKFPTTKILLSYPTLFSEIHKTRSPYRDPDEEVLYTAAPPGNSIVGNNEGTVEINTLVSRLNIHGTEMTKVEFIMEDHGLGQLPHNITSVSSILLFNSTINPYKNYQTIDNLLSIGRNNKSNNNDNNNNNKNTIASAPSTLLSGDLLPDIEALDLLYKPSMGEMSSLALPENLPLDFIANIQFSAVDLPSIAPSAARHGKADYSLPQITDGGMSYSSTSSSSSAVLKASSLVTNAASSSSSPPPLSSSLTSSKNIAPPPPPPPPMSHKPTIASTVVPTINAPPPPPPPPSLSSTSSSSSSSSSVVKTSIPSPPPMPNTNSNNNNTINHNNNNNVRTAAITTMDDHDHDGGDDHKSNAQGGASFLDAIKGMSVAKLRSKEESAIAAQKVQTKVNLHKPLSMAEALKERLARRNDAISGKQDKEKQRRDSLVVQAARQPSILTMSSLDAVSIKPVSVAISKKSIKQTDSTDDSESDAVSEFSDESYHHPASKQRQPSLLSSSHPPPSKVSPPKMTPASIHQPPIAASSERRGSGLMDHSNVAVTNMLSIARNQTHDADSSGDDDWD